MRARTHKADSMIEQFRSTQSASDFDPALLLGALLHGPVQGVRNQDMAVVHCLRHVLGKPVWGDAPPTKKAKESMVAAG